MNLSSTTRINKKLIRTLVSLLIIVPIGFYTKFYSGPAAHWVNSSLGGVFYEIFWCLVLFLFFASVNRRFPKWKPLHIALTVLFMTSILEFLQLWHPPFLEFSRGYFIGSVILGTSFSWSDFPYYFIGCGIGWWWMKTIQRASD